MLERGSTNRDTSSHQSLSGVLGWDVSGFFFLFRWKYGFHSRKHGMPAGKRQLVRAGGHREWQAGGGGKGRYQQEESNDLQGLEPEEEAKL